MRTFVKFIFITIITTSKTTSDPRVPSNYVSQDDQPTITTTHSQLAGLQRNQKEYYSQQQRQQQLSRQHPCPTLAGTVFSLQRLSAQGDQELLLSTP